MASVVGIVAEYNPFHSGHAYQLARARELTGAEYTVCVMSGAFVQRGEPAALEPTARAQAACRCGADLVVELPLAWSLSSAERFAGGAIGLMHALGVVDAISFGSECGDSTELMHTAQLLDAPELDARIREQLALGDSFAAARQRAAEQLAGEPLGCLARANDTLGVEYLRAAQRLGWTPEVAAVTRLGGAHDADDPVCPSASVLRKKLASGAEIAPYVPEAALACQREALVRQGGIVTTQTLDTALLSRLRMLTVRELAALPDAAEGLEHRLARAIAQAGTMEELYAAAAARRYAASRIRRMTLCAALGIRAGEGDGVPPYARVLAFNDAGRALLRELRGRTSIPVITKPADGRAAEGCAPVLEREAAARDLWCLGCREVAARRPGAFWRETPCYVRDE